MGKPYSDLEKRAIAILAGGGDPGTSQDAGVAKYWKWKINPTAASHNLSTASERGVGRKLLQVTIKPFGLPQGVDALIKATVSKRSKDYFDNKFTAFGIDLIDDQTTGVPLKLRSYRPARVYARTGASATSADRTSRITGRKYKSYYVEADQGYSAPFGKLAATSTEVGQQADIKAALLGTGSTVGLISFTPEKLSI